MNRIPALSGDTTVEEARAIHAQAGPTLASMSVRQKTYIRKMYRARGIPEVILEIVLPKGRPGRPQRAETPGDLPRTVVDGLAERGIDLAKVLSVEDATRAADVIGDTFPNAATQTSYLGKLRKALVDTGASAEAVAATYRPDVTRVHNENIRTGQLARTTAGLAVPPAYTSIKELATRAESFIADNASVEPGQAAADFLVIFSARPGEADTLTLGPRGGVKGALKKRGDDDEWPIVSALGEATARRYMEAWQAQTMTWRSKAMTDMRALAASWAIQPRDLRAIGAHLAATLAATQAPQTAGAARNVQAAALRHGAPGSTPAAAPTDHYTRVLDPAAMLCAKLTLLSLEDRSFIERLIMEKAAIL